MSDDKYLGGQILDQNSELMWSPYLQAYSYFLFMTICAEFHDSGSG